MKSRAQQVADLAIQIENWVSKTLGLRVEVNPAIAPNGDLSFSINLEARLTYREGEAKKVHDYVRAVLDSPEYQHLLNESAWKAHVRGMTKSTGMDDAEFAAFFGEWLGDA